MIDAEPLKPYLAAVAQARADWESVGAAYDAAPADKRGELFAVKFPRAEQAYYRACEELAFAVRAQVKDAETGVDRRTPNPKSQLLQRAVVGCAGMSWDGVTPPSGMGAVLLYVPMTEILGKSPLDIQCDLGLPWHCEGHEPVWFDEHLESAN